MNQVYSFDEYSIPLWVKTLFWGFYMVVFVYAVWKLLLAAPKDKRGVAVGWLILVYFAAYAVFYCVNPDYFSYRDWMDVLNFDFWHKEKVYALIILFCRWLPFNYPYELFRLIVWGGGVLLVYNAARKYRGMLSPRLAVLFLFVLYCGAFSYARASLAMAVFFMGICSYLWAKDSLGKILGIGLAVCSYFFHHELIVGVAMLPSILFPFEKKKSRFFSLIILTLIIGVFTYINSNLALMESLLGGEELSDKMEHFNEKGQGVFRMSTLVSYLHYFYPFYLITKYFYRQKQLPGTIAGLYRITFALFLVTVTFMVTSGLRSTYTYRIMYTTMIPISIMIAYCYNQGYFKKHHLAIMLLLAILTNSTRLINAM